ncbi:MAG: thermonuclease family protein [Thermoleophilaceae bacterium]|nr:thermonuclease family protein [Thermoleophilaceae bacterium]
MRGVFSARGRLATCGVALACALSGCAGTGSSGGESARVTDVIDGDTVEVERLGRVRLIGVDTPERGRCADDAATRFTRDRLLNRVVRYELGEEPKDRYDRTLAYLSRDEQMHNLALLTEGYASVLTIPPNDKYESDFEEAEREAEAADTGALATCDRNRRRAALRRGREEERAREAAIIRLERSRAARAAARRDRAAQRRREARALEEEFAPEPDEDSGSGSGDGGGGGGGDSGGSCLPASACPGKRDGDGDGCYCE